MRVILTYPAPRVSRLAQALQARGHQVAQCPFSALESLIDASGAHALWQGLSSLAAVILVSPGAIEVFAQARPAGCVWPSGVALAVVGPGSREALSETGLAQPGVTILGPTQAPFDGQALAQDPGIRALAGRRVLLVHGEDASDELAQLLAQAGLGVERFVAYRMRAFAPDLEHSARIEGWLGPGGAEHRAVAVFTTVGAVRGFSDWIRARPGLGLPSGAAWPCRALAIHPRVAQALVQAGWQQVQLIEPGMASLLAELESGS